MQQAIESQETIQEFLTSMDVVFNEARDSQAPFVLTVSMIHPKDKVIEEVDAVLEYSLDGVVASSFETKLTDEALYNIISYFETTTQGTHFLPKFSKMTIESLIENIFGGYVDDEDMENSAYSCHSEAVYAGIVSQLKIELNSQDVLTYSSSYGMQIYADTTKQELQEAKSLGIEETFKPSSPDRYVHLGDVSVISTTRL